MCTNKIRRLTFLLMLGVIVSGSAYCKSVSQVKQWKRFVVSYHNRSWNGNPFDLRFTGRFTSPSGKTFTQLGFYAGKNTWKIYFMPNETGKWTFKTTSPDADLNARSGSFNCVQSNLPGELVPEKNRWTFTGDGGAFPVIWNPVVPDDAKWGFRSRKASNSGVRQALRMAGHTVGATLLGFGALVIKPIGWAKTAPQSAVPYVIGKEGKRFNFTFWNRLNAKLDRAREQGLGAYIMLYSDDEQTPDHFGITPRSKEERRLFRYVIARLAAYPNVLWDSGIDIGEYRKSKWIDWYAQWFHQHDPWQHPVGSRTGGGSGGTMPHAATYYSLGDVSLPSRADLLGELKRPVPVAHTDHWRPFIKRGHWTNEKLRIAAWRCALSGFQAFYADYHAGFNEHAKTKKGAKYIGYVTRFFKNLVGADNDDAKMRQGAKYIGYATHFFKDLVQSDLRNLRPHDELLAGGDNVLVAANPGHEYMLYFENGGPARLNLSGPSHTFNVLWYNPRTGEKHREQAIKSGKPAQFIPPTQGKDWVFLLQRHGK